MKIRHLIFTTFGVGILDELWLLYRMELFKRTVFSSLSSQSDKEFIWYIFIDDNIPRIFEEKLRQIVKGSPLKIEIQAVEDYSLIANAIKKITSSLHADCLITSRIDDDDCIRRDIIKIIKEEAVRNYKENTLLVIALKNGMEFLPSDNCARPITYDSIALCLSLADYSKKGDKKSVTNYAHHKILETLEAQYGEVNYSAIEMPYPLYLYTKHPLSDSSFFGAKARILADDNKVECSPELFESFGICENEMKSLQVILTSAPIGMPYKYLEKLAQTRRALKQSSSDGAAPDTSQLRQLNVQKRHLESVCVRPNPNRFSLIEKRKIRVAIIGSCATSDLFEHAKYLTSKLEITFYSARSSIISYLSLPNTNDSLDIKGDKLEEKLACCDLNKSHWVNLEESLPDMVLVDFIDERIGLIRYEGSYFTASGPMIAAFERAGVNIEILRPWSEQVMALRAWAVEKYLQKIASICKNIFVHKAEWAESYINENKEVVSFEGGEFEKLISLNNHVLHDIFQHVESSMVPVDIIGGKEVGMLAGGSHKWAMCPYHYDRAYYSTLGRQIVARQV